jgi:hypothetical protein
MRRIVLTVAVVLLFGALINITVAWGCSLWLDVFQGASQFAPDNLVPGGIVRASRFRRSGAAYFEVIRSGGLFRSQSAGSAELELTGIIPQWTGLGAASPAWVTGELREDYRGVDARGWPMLSLWLEYSGPGSPLEVRGGITVEKLRASWTTRSSPLTRYGKSFPVALPFRLRWPGFLTNTLFYSLLLGLIAWSWVSLRKLVRIRRGRCPACGYPMGVSDTCSECGSKLHIQQVAQPIAPAARPPVARRGVNGSAMPPLAAQGSPQSYHSWCDGSSLPAARS